MIVRDLSILCQLDRAYVRALAANTNALSFVEKSVV